MPYSLSCYRLASGTVLYLLVPQFDSKGAEAYLQAAEGHKALPASPGLSLPQQTWLLVSAMCHGGMRRI